MLSCDVCQRPKNEVKQLVALPRKGPPFSICDRCTLKAFDSLSRVEESQEALGKLPYPGEIKALLNDHVIGQERAKEDIAVAIYNHYKRRDLILSGADLGVEISKSNILVMGPSGCGKTELVRAIAKKLQVPLYIGDATRLTVSGYVGDDVDTLLKGLLIAANGDQAKAEWGIVFLDEADKMARKGGRTPSGYRDISGEGVQQSLLKLIEGSRTPLYTGLGGMTNINTENILFIFAGSFAGIDEIVRKRLVKRGIGFSTTEAQTNDEVEIFPNVREADLLEFGFIPELLGRLPVRTYVNPLTQEEMVRILTEPRNALIKQYEALFQIDGITLEFEPEVVQAIATEACRSEFGARTLRGILERTLKPFAFDLPGKGETKLTVTKEIFRKNSC